MSGKSLCMAMTTAAAVIMWPALWSYAGELEQRSNPVPNGSIVIDGDFADWAGVTPFSPDPAGDAVAGSNDWIQAWMAHDDTYIFFRFERAPGSLPFTNAGYRVILDTDENIATGRSVLGSLNLSVGGEFSSNSVLSMDRWPPGASTCTSGLGSFGFAANSIPPTTVFEARVLRSALTTNYSDPGAPPATEFRFVCYGYTGTAFTDVYPDGGYAGGTDYFHYSVSGAIPPEGRPAGMVESLSNPLTAGAITIDGDLLDWAGVTPYPDDPAGDGGRDFKTISIAHDDTYYYFRLEAAANSPNGLNDGTGWFWIMIDTNPAVAQWTGWNSTDSTDYIFQGPLIGGWGTSWDLVAFPSPLSVEGAVLRSDIGDPAAMNLVFVGDNGPEYYPDNAFSADYVHYTVHPPTPTGGDPIEVYTLSNKVAGGAITIDGDFSDWTNLAFFPDDAAGDGGANQDWVRASIAHDDTHLYLMVERTPGSMAFDYVPLGQGYWIVLDTDRDKATGFTGFGARSFSIGGEFNWGGLGTNAWTASGCFERDVPTVFGMPPSQAEFAIPRSTFGDPVDFNFALIGENPPYDLYPDGADTAVFHYTTGAPLDPLPPDIAVSLSNPVADGAIQPDRTVSDWASVTPYPVDPSGDGGSGSQDWVQVWVAHDSNNFYFRLARAPGSLGWATPGYWIAFDVDRNPATGIKLGGTNTGAEFNTGGIVGFNRWNADGSYAGPASFTATGESSSTRIEASIPLVELGNPSRFRVICVGENSGDYYPEGANADRAFLYTFRPCPRPFADADGDNDVDQADFGVWQACYSGDGIPAAESCLCFDRDYGGQGDGDVDALDLIAFARCFGGPTIPARADCEE